MSSGRPPTVRIEDTGPLDPQAYGDHRRTRSRRAALDFMERAHAAGKPFFLWWNSTRMHIWTHLKTRVGRESTGLGVYPGRHGGARRA